jgi:hypothetical protein
MTEGETKIEERYLGDGLYASFDGWQFYLRAPRGISPEQDHWVGLDLTVLAALYLFTADCLREKQDAFLKKQGLKLIGGKDYDTKGMG